MASSAAHISATAASVHAPHGKAHNKPPQTGDSFSDLLAGAGMQEEKVSASARDTNAKTANSEKPAPRDPAKNETAMDRSDNRTVSKDGQAEAAPMDTADKDARPVTDGKTETPIAGDAANDNATNGMLVDAAAALPQAAQPAPPPEQPAPTPVLTLATQPAAQDANQPASEDDTHTAQADIAPVTGNPPAKTAPQLPEAQSTGENTQNAQAPGAGDKPAAPEAALSTAKDVATNAKAASGDFSKALQETQAGQQDVQSAPAAGETFKPAETAAAAPRPSPETNSITLATPAAPAHQPLAPQGGEKPVMTAQTTAEGAPPPTPNVNQMAVEVAARSEAGAKQFEIRLDPPELGRVEVRLSIDAHGKAEAHLTADQPQTLELLQKDAPTLARALRDAGLNVAQDALNFSLKNQQQQAGGDDASRQGARGNFHNPRTQTEQPESGAYTSRGLGLLDIKV